MKAYHLLMGLLLSAILVGVTWGATTEELKYVYSMEQSVQGNGFFSSYQDLTASELLLKNLDHGSGNYSSESEYSVQNQAKYNTDTDDYYLTGTLNDLQFIRFNKSTDYVYAASSFDFGRSFQAAAFQSKGQEGTCLKNYAGNRSNLEGISMNALFRELDVLSSETSGELSFKQKYTDDNDHVLVSLNSSGNTMLNLESAFTGKGHIGVLNAIGAAGKGHIGVPDVEIDEDYIGTFSLSKKMSQDFEFNWKRQDSDWLPCCFGGYLTMPTSYLGDAKLKGAVGVFDCTCFKAPIQAQFPRVY
ncbi:MAG TPA: hypothetical protein VMY43_03475 [Methanothrix sp.]|nr:hypothetical protein [Methanothrix sp.]